jgi:hypothetical protein
LELLHLIKDCNPVKWIHTIIIDIKKLKFNFSVQELDNLTINTDLELFPYKKIKTVLLVNSTIQTTYSFKLKNTHKKKSIDVRICGQ